MNRSAAEHEISLLAKLWQRAAVAARQRPALFFPAMRGMCFLGGGRALWLPGPSTELLIEGYPRSGNTFARRAFLGAQARPVEVASHAHALAAVWVAVGRGIPVLLLIRAPEEVVSSEIATFGRMGPRDELREYVRFYERLLPRADRFTVATFSEVCEDFGKVIARLNRQHDTRFEIFCHTEANERALGARMSDVSRPGAAGLRHKGKERARAALADEALRPLRCRAQVVFRRMEEIARRQRQRFG